MSSAVPRRRDPDPDAEAVPLLEPAPAPRPAPALLMMAPQPQGTHTCNQHARVHKVTQKRRRACVSSHCAPHTSQHAQHAQHAAVATAHAWDNTGASPTTHPDVITHMHATNTPRLDNGTQRQQLLLVTRTLRVHRDTHDNHRAQHKAHSTTQDTVGQQCHRISYLVCWQVFRANESSQTQHKAAQRVNEGQPSRKRSTAAKCDLRLAR